jgi:hypothetical protein
VQDTFYQENAKLLAEASEQMQQEVRNLFPTVANTGVLLLRRLRLDVVHVTHNVVASERVCSSGS